MSTTITVIGLTQDMLEDTAYDLGKEIERSLLQHFEKTVAIALMGEELYERYIAEEPARIAAQQQAEAERKAKAVLLAAQEAEALKPGHPVKAILDAINALSQQDCDTFLRLTEGWYMTEYDRDED